MNSNKFNIDSYTRELVKKGGIEQPGDNFTKNVMSQILKDPSLKLNFVSKEDKQSNIWLVISIGVMILGYSIYYFVENGFSFTTISDTVEIPIYFKVLADFFSNLFNELSLSPYILLAVIGVIVLVILDKTIVRYLYSI